MDQVRKQVIATLVLSYLDSNDLTYHDIPIDHEEKKRMVFSVLTNRSHEYSMHELVAIANNFVKVGEFCEVMELMRIS